MIEHDVRVGDRYYRGDEKMTVTRIDLATVEGAVMAGVGMHGAVWSMTYALPLDPSWTRVGRGPMVVLMCAVCRQEEAEPGQVYCWTCTAAYAQDWATLSETDARAMTARLQGFMVKMEET